MAKRKGPFCGGKLRHRDGTCTQPAGKGTSHVGYGRCSWHGGCAPSGRKAALNEQARAELARLDVAPLGDPLTQLALLAGQAVAWKDAMAGRVNELLHLRYESPDGGEQLRSEVALWERALDRCEKFCVSMARLDIDNRLAKISEDQAQVMVGFVTAALMHFGIDFHDDTAGTIVMDLFEQLAGDGGERVIMAIAESPQPRISPVCEAQKHQSCRSYIKVGAEAVPPWPQRCPCNCHDPARSVPRE